MDAGYQANDYKGAKVNGVAGNGSSTSQINFRGTEDLGGGLKANFRVETDWSTVSNNANAGVKKADGTVAAPSTFGNGEIRVGLAGGFGAVDLGAVNYNTLDTFVTGQPFGTAIGSGFRAVTWNDVQGFEATGTAAGSSVRADNAIKYTTPVFFDGFKATLYKSNKQTKANTTNFSTTMGAYDQVGTQELGASYANGPLAVSFSNLTQDSRDVGAFVTKGTVNTLGANYAFGDFKLFGLYQGTTITVPVGNNNKADFMSVSGTYTMGAVVLMAQFGNLKDKTEGSKKSSDSMLSLGVDYNLSKRTALYARYESINDKIGLVANSGQLPGVAGQEKRVRSAFGVRHAF